MIPPRASLTCHGSGFPRVSGDDPWEVLEADFQMTFSPRERG